MGFFDFLKKKELKQIQELKNKVLELKNDISNIKEYNLDLKKRNDALSIYEQIEDAKKEADIIIGNAKHEARNILQKNQIEVNRLKSQSQDELSEISAQIEHQTKIKEGIIQYANDQAKEILKDLRQKVTIAKDKAEQQRKINEKKHTTLLRQKHRQDEMHLRQRKKEEEYRLKQEFEILKKEKLEKFNNEVLASISQENKIELEKIKDLISDNDSWIHKVMKIKIPLKSIQKEYYHINDVN